MKSPSGPASSPPARPSRRRSARLLGVVAAAALGASCFGCHDPGIPTRIPEGLHSPFAGYSSPRYGDGKMWLCRPDLPSDACRVDLTETEIRADGSRAVVPRAPAPPAKTDVDCFYVYPTVDLGFFAANHTDFDNLEKVRDVAAWQAAHFSEVCSVYAPLYRQVTIGTYLSGRREQFLSVAFSDVEDAFLHYMSHYNHGRRVVLVGHSQGADMVVRLLEKRFDRDPAMREKLVVAMPIGGPVVVAAGRLSGGSLTNVPVCTREDETGCVVAYHSHRGGEPATAGFGAPPPGRETVCVNPAGNGDHYFRRTVFAVNDKLRKKYDVLRDVKTPYVAFPDYYAGRCVAGEHGYDYLEVRAAPQPGDQREAPLDLDSFWFGGQLGLHVLDMQFPQGDLVDLVRRKAAAAPPVASPPAHLPPPEPPPGHH